MAAHSTPAFTAEATLHSMPFTLRSKAFDEGASLGSAYYGDRFGCQGGNMMPDLYWHHAPLATLSFAVTLYDRDAPTGSGFWHWIAYDLPADTSGLPGGRGGTALPQGAIEGNTDLGTPGFFGPCPPAGRKHRYVFAVHALRIANLPVVPGSSPSMVGFHIWQHRVAKATLSFEMGLSSNQPFNP